MKPELRTVFLAESRELLSGLRRGLTQSAERPQTLPELFRLAHTLKGDARFAELPDLELVAGRIADELKSAKARGSISADRAALLSEAVDACQDLLGSRADRDVSELMQRLGRPADPLAPAAARASLRILLIEDSELQSQVIRKALLSHRGVSFSIDQAGSLAEGLKRVKEGSFDAALLDLNLPDSQGADTFARFFARVPALPVVILTVSDDDALALEALRQGAQDYQVKSQISDSGVLSRVILYAIERKRAEEALRRMRDELEVRVRERTAELNRANEELTRSNSELRQFASIAAHELQEPLRKIVMFGDLLERRFAKDMDPQALGFLSKMKNAALREGDLITSLRQLTMVTQATRPFEPVDLNAVLADLLTDLAPVLAHIGGRVEARPLPVVKADAVQMHQVFQNLLGNAVKYRDKKRPLLIKISSRSPKAGIVEIAVEDNGIGFDSQYREKILEPFRRLHTREEFEGLGMGLAICAKIMQRHGGGISAQGKPGEGAAFTLTLPAVEPKP